MTIFQLIIKRSFDLVFSALGLITLWPLMLLCVLVSAVETSSSGLFTQERVGRKGRLFNMRKIRTMSLDSHGLDSTITVAEDPRITSFGRFLRKYKLDELPQLWNVLIGEMSFVGPRPDVPGYADALRGEERMILELRPGITGPASIKYRNEEHLLAKATEPSQFNNDVLYPDKVRINLQYARNWSFLQDIRYIFITLRLLSPPAHLKPLHD